jgi:hypothetical protein
VKCKLFTVVVITFHFADNRHHDPAYVKLLNDKLILWNRSLLKKLIVTQLVKKLPAFMEPEGFIAVFTRAYNLSLS